MNAQPRSLEFKYVTEQSRSILVVDDDPIQREFANVYLSAPGVQLEAVASAREALEALEATKFDIVLVDYEMPDMNGLELISAIRANMKFAALPLMMVTSHEDTATIEAAFKAGATSFFTKPVNWRLLGYQIEYVLRAHTGK